MSIEQDDYYMNYVSVTFQGITNSLAGPRATGHGSDIRAGAFGNTYP